MYNYLLLNIVASVQYGMKISLILLLILYITSVVTAGRYVSQICYTKIHQVIQFCINRDVLKLNSHLSNVILGYDD